MVNDTVNAATLPRLIERCQALAALMSGVAGVPPDTARQIAESATLAASADDPDWVYYFARQLSGLSAGVVTHLTLDAPAALDDLLAGIDDDGQALRPLLGPSVPADPALQQALRDWQREHGVTPQVRDEPSPLR